MTRSETGYAKINLALHVRRRRPDGYHEIETIFAFAEDGDLLSIAGGSRLNLSPQGKRLSRPGYSLSLRGPFAEGLSGEGDNLVLRAARAAFARFPDVVPAGGQFILDKRLPIAAGIGGGSADAAAALRLLCQGTGAQALHDLAAGLGADVSACLRSRACRGEGVGERLTAIDDAKFAGMPILLVNPRVPCATGPVFAGWDGLDRGTLAKGDPLAAALAGRNDLEASARRIVPVIGEVLAALADRPGVVLARMSGSGATCFALFESDRRRDDAAAAIAAARPGWWCLVSRLR